MKTHLQLTFIELKPTSYYQNQKYTVAMEINYDFIQPFKSIESPLNKNNSHAVQTENLHFNSQITVI